MLTKDNIQLRASVFVVAMGIVFLATLSLFSLDIPVRHDATDGRDTAPVVPDTAGVVENWNGNSGNVPYPSPVPPVSQKRFLR